MAAEPAEPEEPGTELERYAAAEGLSLLDAARAYITRAVYERNTEALAELRRKARTAEVYYSSREAARDLANDYGEVKVRAERGLGQMDTEVNPHGGDHTSEQVHPPVNLLGVGRNTRAGWRKLAAMPDADFEAYLATAREDQDTGVSTARVLRGNHRPFVGHNSGEYEWYSPAAYLAAAREVLGTIDLDPASTADANEVVGAVAYYTAESDGLDPEQPWSGRVWMNPPYSHPEVDQFCGRLCREWDEGTVRAALVLVNNATETGYFQDLAARSSAVCFPRGRLGGEGGFWHPDRPPAAPLQGQAVLYLGADVPAFRREFGGFGFIAEIRGGEGDG